MSNELNMDLNESEQPHWGFLVYIAGDNNLSQAASGDIEEMCREGSSDSVYVGVEIDSFGDEGTMRYEIAKAGVGNDRKVLVEELPEQNSGDPQTFENFLKWGLPRSRAANKIVVISGHGGGFCKDVGTDFSSRAALDMREIENAMEKADIPKEGKLRIFGFDACLMNSLEVAHHFENQADIIIASQESQPKNGWPYDSILKMAKDTTDEVDLCKSIVSSYIEHYDKEGVEETTLSALRLNRTQPVIDALDKLGTVLIQADRSEIVKIRKEVEDFEFSDYVDLKHLAELLRSSSMNGTEEVAQEIIDAIGDCVIATGKGKSAQVDDANGISIWFPERDFFHSGCRDKYMQLKCNENSFGWTNFLDAYHKPKQPPANT